MKSSGITNRPPTCAIVIRCYNEEKHIGKLLHGISQQTIKHPEIIVVDSGSTDGTLTIASRFPVKVVSIRSEEFSFGRSLNLGCSLATQEFIVIASAHVYPLYKDWLENLLSPFDNPQIALVYGKQRGGNVTKFSENQVFLKWFPDNSNTDQDHPFCNNANAAIRRELWEKYPYDEELTGLEDLAWSNNILQSGYKIAYRADAPIVHIHDEVPKHTYNRYRREAIALKRIYPKENFNLLDFFSLYFQNVVNDYRQAIHNRTTVRDLYEIPLFRFMQFWGTYQGFKTGDHITRKIRQKFYYPNRIKPDVKSEKQESQNPHLIDYQNQKRTYRENR